MTNHVLILVLFTMLQGVLTGGNPDTPRINRDEDLRRRTEESMNRRADEIKKLQLERDRQQFQDNVAKLAELARETCALRNSEATKASQKMIIDHAKKMDSLSGESFNISGPERKH